MECQKRRTSETWPSTAKVKHSRFKTWHVRKAQLPKGPLLLVCCCCCCCCPKEFHLQGAERAGINPSYRVNCWTPFACWEGFAFRPATEKRCHGSWDATNHHGCSTPRPNNHAWNQISIASHPVFLSQKGRTATTTEQHECFSTFGDPQIETVSFGVPFQANQPEPGVQSHAHITFRSKEPLSSSGRNPAPLVRAQATAS